MKREPGNDAVHLERCGILRAAEHPGQAVCCYRQQGHFISTAPPEVQHRLKQTRWCPICERKVEWREVARGYEHTQDRYVVLTDEDFEARYQSLLDQGYAQKPLSPAPAGKKPGRRKKTKLRNLLERLDEHRQKALAVMYDFRSPSTATWPNGTFA